MEILVIFLEIYTSNKQEIELPNQRIKIESRIFKTWKEDIVMYKFQVIF